MEMESHFDAAEVTLKRIEKSAEELGPEACIASAHVHALLAICGELQELKTAVQDALERMSAR